MSGLGSAAAAGSGTGNKIGSSKLLVAGLAGVGVAAGAGLLYFGYLKPKAAKKRQEELNKKFESGGFIDTDFVNKKADTDTKPKQELNAKSNPSANADANAKAKAELETPAVDEHAGRHQERAVNRDVIIPRDMASSFIGKNGAYVKKLQADTKTRISSKAVLDNGDRVYAISGLSHDVALAEHEVARFISLQPVCLKSEIMIPSDYVGAVIGTKGETVRSLQERSKARIQIDPQPDSEVAFFAPSASSTRTTTPVVIRGSEREVALAKELIQDIVNSKMRADQRNANSSRNNPNPRVLKPVSPSAAAGRFQVSTSGEKEQIATHLKADGTLTIYVTCVFDPNSFFIQIFNTRTSTQLNRLTEEMTEYYHQVSPHGEEFKFKVGDVVVASWEHDTRMHRAQVIGVKDGDQLEIRYVDYGDKRVLRANQLRQMKTEFLRLRFQALEATLNMEEPRGGWTDTIIDEFSNLTHSGNWVAITGKRVDFLQNLNANEDKVCLELYQTTRNNNININEELRRFIRALESAPQQQSQAQVSNHSQIPNTIHPSLQQQQQLSGAAQGADVTSPTFGLNGSQEAVKIGAEAELENANAGTDSGTVSASASSPEPRSLHSGGSVSLSPPRPSSAYSSSSSSSPERNATTNEPPPPPSDAFPSLQEVQQVEPPVAPIPAPAPAAFSYAAMARKK